MQAAGLAFFVSVLLAAAAWDLRSYCIPNMLPLLLGAGGLASLAAASGAVWQIAGTVGLVSLASLALFVRGYIGGGDAKLLMACSLWIPLPDLPTFGVLLGLASAAQGLVALLWIRARSASGRPILDPGPHRMPYAVSIAAAGLGWAARGWAGVPDLI